MGTLGSTDNLKASCHNQLATGAYIVEQINEIGIAISGAQVSIADAIPSRADNLVCVGVGSRRQVSECPATCIEMTQLSQTLQLQKYRVRCNLF